MSSLFISPPLWIYHQLWVRLLARHAHIHKKRLRRLRRRRFFYSLIDSGNASSLRMPHILSI